MAQGEVPVRESVGAALRFVRDHARFVMIVAVIGAAGMTLCTGLALTAPALGIVTSVLSTVIQAFAYGALVAAALFGADAARGRWMSDGGRVWPAMALIGLFLFIVMFVACFVASIVLVAGPLGPYLEPLENARGDNAVVMSVMVRFAEENPLALLFLTLFIGAIWMLLTSRLYLSAPASVDRKRVLTFETWKWTKGAMLRITAARLFLLLPAYALVFALAQLVGRVLGIDTLNPEAAAASASANPTAFLAYAFVTGFVSLALYSSLEAGLSSYLYRGLEPAEKAPAAVSTPAP